ncbi:MAG: LemA family protein [Rhodothermales bacterium]|nr:LemA family protein [Rhodothermales bacterium]
MRSKGSILLLVIVLLVAFAGCAGCTTWNSLVSEEEQVEQAWADVESTYQRRADLIPNLVNTVQGAADFERETLEAVTDARARATSINLTADDLADPARLQAYQEAQAQLSGALGRLLAVAENYPQLRATEAFRDLQAQLEGTENRINVARSRYNEAVRAYNTRVRRFPAALFAGVFGFDRRAPFEADEGAEQAPTVDFNS